MAIKTHRLFLGILLALLLLLTACTSDEGTDVITDPSSDSAQSGTIDGMSTDPSVPNTPSDTTAVTAPETEIIDGSTVYSDGYNAHMLVGFDEYGRLVEPTLARKQDKEIGIFYFLWLGTPHFPEIYDVSEILKTYGKDTLLYQNNEYSPLNQAHFWGKPLFGYYNSGDEWVMRKHMEMLTTAGVDFLVFDTTNGYTYDAVVRRLLKVITELRGEGWDTPQVVYMTHSYSISTVRSVYQGIYKAYPEYEEAWYKVDGKPMIIAYTTEAEDLAASGDTRDGKPYRPGDLESEICDFFHIRHPLWPDEETASAGNPGAWPYTDWSLPPVVNGDMMTVSVATNPRPPFSYGLLWEDWPNFGRGFDVTTMQNRLEDAMKGTFFDAQWEAVYQNEDKLTYVFICAWNQWVAWKLDIEGYEGYIFVDSADMQYSFDAEPMEGGYEDAYYIQMMAHIRRFKYEPLAEKVALTLHKSIDVSGPISQWEDVNAVYRRVGQDDGKRSKYGASKTVDYACDPVVNNLVEVRVTSDDENLYFMIRTTDPIADMADGVSGRMNLFIGRDRPATGKGWEGYEFAVNRERNGNRATIEALSADFTGQKVGEAAFTVQGQILQIAVPRAAVGLEAGGDFYFKIADGVDDPAEIMTYYDSGRSLPLGRLSYLYQLGDD